MAKKKDGETPDQRLRKSWINWIEKEDKAHGEAREKARKVIDRYRDDKRRTGSKFNILWSNVQVLKGALYSATPRPDVRRRFLDKDPVSREAAAVLERGISFSVDNYDFDGTAIATLDDYLLPGYGQARVRYKPYFNKTRVPALPEDDNEPDGLDENGEPYREEEVLAYEEVTCEHVPWENFRWEPGVSKWEDVNKCAIDYYLDRPALIEQFGDIGKKIKLTYGPAKEDKGKESEKTHALVHECFDKRKRQVIVVSPGYTDGPIVVWDDPLKLTGFYPFPKPLFATQTSGDLMPIPDFHFYQDQADELDLVTERIERLVSMLKVRGVYDSSFSELANVLTSDDGHLTPVKDFAERFGSDRDLDSIMATMPLEEIAKVITGLYQQRDQIKQTIYEITGISDIVRGQTEASETLGAQQLKGQYADMRLSSRRKTVNTFFRYLFRIKAEVIAEQFSADTLQLMSGIQVSPEMDQLFKSDVLRAYKIDVETESTMAVDAQEEQKSRVEALTGLTTFLQQAVPAIQAGVFPKEIAKELALFTIRGFKRGRQLEDVIERMGSEEQGSPEALQGQLEQLTQQNQQLQQQMQQGMQYIQQLEGEVKSNQAAAQAKAEVEREKIAATTQLQREKHQMDASARVEEAQVQSEVEINKANIKASTDIAIAELMAKVDMLIAKLQPKEKKEAE